MNYADVLSQRVFGVLFKHQRADRLTISLDFSFEKSQAFSIRFDSGQIGGLGCHLGALNNFGQIEN